MIHVKETCSSSNNVMYKFIPDVWKSTRILVYMKFEKMIQ